jgi:S1-C subfamily serine protease
MLHPDQKGALITSVVEGSPADLAGILKGDIIYQIDGQVVNSVHQVMKKIGLHINDDIKVTIVRHSPFEQDWSGRTFTFLTEIKEFTISNSGIMK